MNVNNKKEGSKK